MLSFSALLIGLALAAFAIAISVGTALISGQSHKSAVVVAIDRFATTSLWSGYLLFLVSVLPIVVELLIQQFNA